jgi:hypothetical protein
MTEEEDILRFREARMTWKHWAIIAAANIVVALVITSIRLLD